MSMLPSQDRLHQSSPVLEPSGFQGADGLLLRSTNILVLADSHDPHGAQLLTQILPALESSGQSPKCHPLSDDNVWPKLGDYDVIVFAARSTDLLGDHKAALLSRYVELGGGLVVLIPPTSTLLDRLLGCRSGVNLERNSSVEESESKLQFVYDLFPGLNGLSVSSTELGHEKFEPYLLPFPDSTIIALDTSDNLAVAWRHAFGCGQIYVWNTDIVLSRCCQGLVVQSILAVQPVGVMSIANFALVQIDDFPAAFSDLEREPLQEEFDLTFIPFLEKIWLPDILDISREFNIPFTFFIPFSYNAITQPPFPFQEWKAFLTNNSGTAVPWPVHFCRQIGDLGEIALHGYNHIPLRMENWSSRDNMIKALRRVIRRWKKDQLGPLPKVFAPPANSFDADGALALTTAIPSLQIICGSHDGDVELGEGRDFKPEPWNPELFGLPRVTYGYFFSPLQRLLLISQLGMMGAWTHFLHPDDIIDIPDSAIDSDPASHRNPNRLFWRNGKLPTFLGSLRYWLEFMKRTYPWLRYYRTSEAMGIMKSHLECRPRFHLDSHCLYLQASTGGHLLVRLQEGLVSPSATCTGAAVLHKSHLDDGEIWFLQMNEDYATISLS